MLHLLLRLRQACSHPGLVKGAAGAGAGGKGAHHHAAPSNAEVSARPPAPAPDRKACGSAPRPRAHCPRESRQKSPRPLTTSPLACAQAAAARRLPADVRASLAGALSGTLGECATCGDIPEDAVVSACGHLYCAQCVSSLLSMAGQGAAGEWAAAAPRLPYAWRCRCLRARRSLRGAAALWHAASATGLLASRLRVSERPLPANLPCGTVHVCLSFRLQRLSWPSTARPAGSRWAGPMCSQQRRWRRRSTRQVGRRCLLPLPLPLPVAARWSSSRPLRPMLRPSLLAAVPPGPATRCALPHTAYRSLSPRRRRRRRGRGCFWRRRAAAGRQPVLDQGGGTDGAPQGAEGQVQPACQ
jgi:hypothetical protein